MPIMISNLKALGLALVAVFAFGVVATSGASASWFETGATPAVITAGEDRFGAVFGTASSTLKIECRETFGGTVGELSPAKITVHPTYILCKEVAGLKVSVDTEGCDYVLYAETTKHLKTEGGIEETDAPVEIECTKTTIEGKEVQDHIKITFKSGLTTVCTLTITSLNSKLHGVIYDNEGSGSFSDIKVTPTVDKIKYTAPGIGCAIGGLKSSGEDGFLTKNEALEGNRGITATGFHDENISGPEPHQDQFIEGSQVRLQWVK
jgi:hypothetical protein